jgi:hypothetical protein
VTPEPCGPAGCASESSRTWEFQTSVNQTLDLLVVVDDAQAGAAAAPQFAQVLANLPRGLPSLHVAFVSASLSADGCSPPPARGPACGLGAPSSYLTTLGCGQQPNFAGSLPDALSCVADLGAASCGQAEPLEAMKRALAGMDGFVRPNAYLEVVIVAAGDDASASDGAPVAVADYVAFLKGLKADPDQIAVSVLGPAAACGTGAPPEQVAPRLVQLVSAFGADGLYAPGCDGRYADALLQLAESIAIDIEPTCLTALRDVDPAADGLQPECVVDDWTATPDGSVHEALLPSCDASSPPCWRLDHSATLCPGGWTVEVDRGPGFCPQVSTRTQVTCLSCADAADPACAAP